MTNKITFFSLSLALLILTPIEAMEKFIEMRNQLYDAYRERDTQKVKALIKSGLNPNIPIKTSLHNDNTILDIMWAEIGMDYPMTRKIGKNTAEIFKDLVNAGAKFRHRTGYAGRLESEIEAQLQVTVASLDEKND